MSENEIYALSAHLLNRQNYKEEIMKKEFVPWIELSQKYHEILLYPIIKDFDFSKKAKFVEEVEFTYRFIHPAIAPTFKYTYSDKFSISYLGNKNSFYSDRKLSNTYKQIVLIGVASAMLYLENKGTSHYCLDVNHLILVKDKFPKLLCAGVPTAFKPDDWDNDISSIKSFGKFAQRILLNKKSIPEPIQTMINKCVNITKSANAPTFEEILNILSNNVLQDAEYSTINTYIQWLTFQDKFPCEYFFDLDERQRDTLIQAVTNSQNEDSDSDENLFERSGYPKDIFRDLYFCEKIRDALQIFTKYYGLPDWLKNSSKAYQQHYQFSSMDEEYLNPCNEFIIDDDSRSKLHSTNPEDIQFVIDSYLKGENFFPQSPEAAFYFVKNLLKKNEGNAILLFELGKMHENGIGTVVNLQKAIQCYKESIRYGHDSNNDLERAELEFKKLDNQISNLSAECKQRIQNAELNNFQELMRVAFSFLHGFNGFPKSQFHALKYYKKAAEIDPYVYCMLGNLFRTGIAFSKNVYKAAKFYQLSNINGCLRGQFYDGFMKMNQYSPFHESSMKQFKAIDKYFFDFANKQGRSNPFNYCKMIVSSQTHFPIMTDFSLTAKDKYRSWSQKEGVDYRIQNNTTFIKESIKLHSDIPSEYNQDHILNATDVQITAWFLFYQMKYLTDNGLLIHNQKPTLSLHKDHNYFFSITEYNDMYSWEKRKKISHLVYKEFKKSVPRILRPIVKGYFTNELSIDENLEELENHLISNNVNKVEFESFVRKCKNFVPLDSSKILISTKVDQAESGDKNSLQECARNYFYGVHPFPINFKESFKYYERLAKDPFNDPNAQMWVGIMHSKGIGIQQDFKAAIEWFKRSSDQDFIQGKLTFALFLEYYNRKIKDPEEPFIPYINLLAKSAESQYPEALFQLGKLKESHASLEYGRTKSIKYYRRASQLGHIESTRRLYHIYKKLGMKNEKLHALSFLQAINDPKYCYEYAKWLFEKRDYENSIKYTEMMLSSKDAKIRKLYGDNLVYGNQKNISLAQKYYIAASKKYPKAIVALAKIYAEGIGCKKDLEKARKIYCQAIDNAWYKEKLVYSKLYCDFCDKYRCYKAAFNFQLKVAHEKKTNEYQYKVAMSYLNPTHKECKKDLKKGKALLTMSADQHYPMAAYELGKSYIYGNYKQKRDFDKGTEYLKSAGAYGHTEALFLLGKIYHKGIGTIPDEECATDYFQKAANKDHPGAKYYLSLNQDLDNSVRHQYLIESADQGYAKAQYIYGRELIDEANENDENYQKGKEYIYKASKNNYKKAKSYYQKLAATNT